MYTCGDRRWAITWALDCRSPSSSPSPLDPPRRVLPPARAGSCLAIRDACPRDDTRTPRRLKAGGSLMTAVTLAACMNMLSAL